MTTLTSPAPPPILSCYSRESIGLELFKCAPGLPTSQAGTANLIRYIPFRLRAPGLLQKLWWWNGATIAANIDIGVCRADTTFLTRTGSTAQAGANVIQAADIADLWLPRGRYYIAVVLDSVNGVLFRTPAFGVSGLVNSVGMASQAGTFPLPANATFAAASGTPPICGLAFRSLVV